MKKRLLRILIIVLVIWFGYNITSNAAISAESKTVKSGESVQIKVTSNQKVGAYTLKVSSNGGTTFQSVNVPDGATAGGTTVTGASTSGMTLLGTYTFKVPTVTSEQKYYIKFSATGMEGPNFEEIKDSTTTATITVKPVSTTDNNSNNNNNNDDDIPQETKPGTTTTKSSNNYLSSLKISEGKLNPEFNFRTYKYTVDVGEETNSIKITAGAEHNKAKVSGTGTKTLKPGKNKFNVTVKAEDGKERTYTITVNKPSEEEKILLKSLKLQGVNLEEEKVELSYSPEFSSEVYEYSVNVANDITKIDVEAIASKEDYTVEITGNEELKEGENIITILVKAKDSDKVTTYKIKVIKEEAVEAVATLDETPNTGEELKDNNIIKIVIVTFTALVAIAGIVFAVIEYNYSKKHPKEKMGKIPYSNIGFKDEETDKEDILEEQKDKKEENEDKDNNREEDKPKKRGKHF